MNFRDKFLISLVTILSFSTFQASYAVDGSSNGDEIIIGDADLINNPGPVTARDKVIGIPDTNNPVDDDIAEISHESSLIGLRPPTGKGKFQFCMFPTLPQTLQESEPSHHRMHQA